MKIYVAKSNKANPDYLLKVRNFLSKFKTVEIAEFQGGTYSNDSLLDSDLLIVIPDLTNGVVDNSITLGKGLYLQIDEFVDENSIEGIFVVTGMDKDGNIQCAYIDECDPDGYFDEDFLTITNEDNFYQYGEVRVSEHNHSLFTTLAELILLHEEDEGEYSDEETDSLWDVYVNGNHKTISESKGSDYKYLLIKK